MRPNQKAFLKELGTLFRKYNIDSVYGIDGSVKFKSNGTDFCFETFHKRQNGDWMFEHVVSKEDYNYKFEDLPESKPKEQNDEEI